MKRILTAFLCLYAAVALAQIPGIYKYTQLNGYRPGVGYRVNEDEKGYLWIGTDDGGLRFDGKYFVSLQDLHHSPNAEILECIPFNHNKVAMVPLSGRLFFLDHDTVTYLDDATTDKIESTRWHNQYHHSVNSNAGWLWDINSGLNIKYTVYRFSDKTGLQKAEFPPAVFPLYVIDDHILTNERDKQYGIRDFQTGKQQMLYHADYTPFFVDEERFLNMDRSSGIILVSEVKTKNIIVYQWTKGDSILKKISRLNGFFLGPVLSSYSEQKKQYLFAPDVRSPKMISYYSDLSDSNSASKVLLLKIPDADPPNCFVDRHNNIWITSRNNALYFLSANHVENALSVQRLPLKEQLPQCISGNAKQLFITYVASPSLSLLSGTKAVHCTLNTKFPKGCRNIMVLNDSQLIAYSRDIALVNTRKGTISYFGFDETFKNIIPYGSGFLAAASSSLSYIYRSTNGKYRMEKIFWFRSVAVASMAGAILIGTPSGMYTKQGLKGATVKLSDKLSRDADVSDIALLDSSHALIATNGKGLLLYDKYGKISIPAIVEKNGIPIPRYIRHLHRSGPFTYWAATNMGAFCIRFTPAWQVESVKNYSFYDGLPSNNVTSIFVRRDTAYIATTEGMGVIYLKEASYSEMPVPLAYINSVEAGKLFFREPDQELRLLHDQNNVRVQLSAISYESLGNIAYFYRLNPYQKEWIKTLEPDIRFSHLPPGHYRFEFYATNAKGGKSTITSLLITIKPAFWQTIYFKIIIVALFIALVFAFISFRIKRIEKKRHQDMQQKKHLAELELEAIKAQINPHFIYNCLNSIQYLNYKADYEQAQQYLNTFSRLIRKTMYYAQKVFITVDEEVEYLSNYLQMEQLRFKDRLHYTITVDKNIKNDTSLPAMLLQPYVENALKHGIFGMSEGGYIDIFFKSLAGGVEITIRDNGPGFSSTKSQDALGLRLSGTRAVTYSELFNINVKVACYNEQDRVPEKTGAVVKITITQTKNGTDPN